MTVEFEQCPYCNVTLIRPFVALSRREGVGDICPECGRLEAIEDLLKAGFKGELPDFDQSTSEEEDDGMH